MLKALLLLATMSVGCATGPSKNIFGPMELTSRFSVPTLKEALKEEPRPAAQPAASNEKSAVPQTYETYINGTWVSIRKPSLTIERNRSFVKVRVALGAKNGWDTKTVEFRGEATGYRLFLIEARTSDTFWVKHQGKRCLVKNAELQVGGTVERESRFVVDTGHIRGQVFCAGRAYGTYHNINLEGKWEKK